jgi:hypothetical protein
LFRNVLGTKNLSEILSERETIGDSMHRALEAATDPWGVHVDRVEIKDVRLPQQMQRSMAAEAEATRDARAKVGDFKVWKFGAVCEMNKLDTRVGTDKHTQLACLFKIDYNTNVTILLR